MLTKCICTNCSGHLEFEEENVGEKIKCPHCGWETELYDASVAQPVTEPLGVKARLRKHARLLSVAGAAILLLGFLGFAVYRWGLPFVQGLFPLVEGNLMLVLILLAGVWGVIAALLWTAFPIVLFLQLRGLTAVLRNLEIHSHPPGAETLEADAPDWEENQTAEKQRRGE